MGMKDKNYKFFTDFWKWIDDSYINVHIGFRKTAESQDVPFDYMCAICHDLLYKPQRCLPCGHIFCDPCLRRLSSIRNRKCPMCREKIEKCLPSPKLSQKLSEKYTSQYEKRFYMEQESEINRYPLPPIQRNLTEVLEDNQITGDMVAFFIFRLILALSCKLVLYGVDIPYLIKHSVFVSLNQYVLYTIVIRGNKDVWYWTVGTFQAIEITKDIYVLWIAFIAYSSEYLFDWGAIEDEL